VTPRTLRLLWALSIVLVGAGLLWAYMHFVVGGAAPFKWTRRGVEYELLQPGALGVLLVVPLLLFALGRSLADLPWQQRVLSLLLRIAFVLLLGLSLGRLAKSDQSQNVASVFCIDVSDSVQDPAIEQARRWVEEAVAKKRTDDVIKVISFAERPRLLELDASSDKLELPPVAELRHGKAQAGGKTHGKASAATNIQAALELAYGVLPAGYLKRVVVLSDGVETQGNVLAEANRARQFGVKVFSVPYRQPPPGEVAVRELHVPDKVDVGQAFDVTASVYSSRSTKARARLYKGETLNGLDGVREVELTPGENELKFQSVVRVGGEVSYAFELDQVGEDTFTENNRYMVTVDVPGRPSVLYVEGQPARASYLTSALSAQQYDVDVRAPGAFPGSIKELERYDFVIVSDTPAESVSLTAQGLIEKYVRDLGGGFLFAGGEAGYGLGGWAHTTVERLLPVRMDAERHKDMPSVAMALVIDRSGSMTGLPMEMAKAACKATVSTLAPDDVLEIIAFDSTPVRYVKMQPARYRSRIENDVLRIQPGGGTEIFPALDMAYQDISVVQARKKHVILLTDGRAPTQGIKDLVQAMLAESITVTTVGLGEGADGDFLRMLADSASPRSSRAKRS
jgi:Ca-activated chloride channel homolog